MTGEFSPTWLALREPADATARATELIDLLPPGISTIRDLGCGTGSLGRWLAPQLAVPQRWILQDLDSMLLAQAADQLSVTGVTASTTLGDVTTLTAAELADTDLVTCSALLDLLTGAELAELAAVCAASHTSALFTLSVAGLVTLEPADPRDDQIRAAFNEHQRRTVDGRQLLGPDAPDAAVVAFEKAGATVVTRTSPWQLGPHLPELTAAWLRGWVGAAQEQDSGLGLGDYLSERLAHLPAARVEHVDLLAIFD